MLNSTDTSTHTATNERIQSNSLLSLSIDFNQSHSFSLSLLFIYLLIHLIQFQKLLFSATLTTNPAKLASLQLRQPLFFNEATAHHKKYSIPSSLKQRIILCETGNKPLVLIYLLKQILFEQQLENKKTSKKTDKKMKESDSDSSSDSSDSDDDNDKSSRMQTDAVSDSSTQSTQQTDDWYLPARQVLIFTASLQSTHRLYRLLELFGLESLSSSASPATASNNRLVAEYSSSLTQSTRSSLVHQFRSGSLRVLICSDVMARGIDLPSIDCVINYDVPIYIKTYIHRVGRTARAEKLGVAYTLCRKQETNHFYSILKQAENSFLVKVSIRFNQLQSLVNRFSDCLSDLKDVLTDEERGRVNASTPLPAARRKKSTAAADSSSSTVSRSKSASKPNMADMEALIEADDDSGSTPATSKVDKKPASTAAKPVKAASSSKASSSDSSSSSDESSSDESDDD